MTEKSFDNYFFLHSGLVQEENRDAYEYLFKLYCEQNDRLDIEPANPEAEKAYQIVGEEFDQKIQELFCGLTQYFKQANNVQEEVIRRSVNTAREVLIGEALLVGLDGHQFENISALRERVEHIIGAMLGHDNIKQEDPLVTEIRESGVGALSTYDDEKLAAFAQVIGISESATPDFITSLREPTGQDLQNIFDAYTYNPHSALDSLVTDDLLQMVNETASEKSDRKSLKAKVQALAASLALPEMQANPKRLKEFRDSRENLTVALNAYDRRLSQMYERIEPLLEQFKDDGRADVVRDKKVLSEYALELLLRRDQLEEFRNGFVDPLPLQTASLNFVKLESADFQQALGIKTPPLGCVMEDIATPFRTLEVPLHPLINTVMSFQNNLQALVCNSENEVYRKNQPGITFRENGVKSWRRTIEKLVQEKTSDWEKMTDLARISVVFNRAESKYHYNEVFRRLSVETAQSPVAQEFSEGWKIDPPKPKTLYSERGLVLTPTGTHNWIINPLVKAKTKDMAFPWGCEVKLEEAQQCRFEFVTHKLFECTRLLEDDNRALNFDVLTPKKFNDFVTKTQSTLAMLDGTQKPALDAIKAA